MDQFLNNAREILETAESAARRREPLAETTILIGSEGGIHMMMDSDWPLESLTRHYGARAGYRISARHGVVQVDGLCDGRSCRLRTVKPAAIHRALLGCR